MRLLFQVFIFILLISQNSIAKDNLLDCVDSQNGTINKIFFNEHNQTWSNEININMPSKLIENTMYAVFEFPKDQSQLYSNATMEFNIKDKQLYLSFYKVEQNEILHKMQTEYSRFMNKNQIINVNQISEQDKEYMYFTSLKNNFTPVLRTISICSEPKTINSINHNLLVNLTENAKNLQTNQLPEFYVELGYIFNKAVIDQNKCLKEYELYSNVNKEHCTTLLENHVKLYVPTENISRSIIPQLDEAVKLYGEDPNPPLWYNQLNIELEKINNTFIQYFANREKLQNIFKKFN